MANEKKAKVATAAQKELQAAQDVKAAAEKAKRALTAPEAKRLKDATAAVKSERFVMLGKKRTVKAVKVISLVGNLTGAGYAHTPEQAKKIVDALTAAVKNVADKFAGTSKTEAEFDL